MKQSASLEWLKYAVEKGISYEAYVKLMDNLLAQKTTTNGWDSPEILEYTQLNQSRMKRLEKQMKLLPYLENKLQNLNNQYIWLLLAESWCGDVAQNLPMIARMAAQSPQIDLKIIMRDEFPKIMDFYLTDGGRSIPKLICLSHDFRFELGTWGPRPLPVQQMLFDFKQEKDGDYKKFAEAAHKWYHIDKNITLQSEFSVLLNQWEKSMADLALSAENTNAN